jgi:hypothetical protein
MEEWWLAWETEETGTDASWMSVLPPRIWRDVAWTDPNVPGRDTGCCVMTRCLNHSHVLYVRTELLQLHYMCHCFERSEGRTVAAEHTDIWREAFLNWGRSTVPGVTDVSGHLTLCTLAVLRFRHLLHHFLKLGDCKYLVEQDAALCSECGTAEWIGQVTGKVRGAKVTVVFALLYCILFWICRFYLYVTCYFPKQPSMDGVGVCDGDRLCSLWGRNWDYMNCRTPMTPSPHVVSDAMRCGIFAPTFRSSAAPPDHMASCYST